jgi:hypothetical protein
MARSLKDNWRDSIRMTSTEIVNCDTPMPIDIEKHRTPLLFNIRPVSDQVIDTKNIRLSVKFRLLKKKDNEYVGVENADKVALHNNFGFGLFEDVHLNINGVPAETAQREYGRSSYLKNLLFTDNTEKRMLESALFYEDTPGMVDTYESNTNKNWGQAMRAWKIRDKKAATFLTPVYLDIFQAGAYFPDNIGFTLNFYPSRLVNCILNVGDETPLKLEILQAQLFVPRCHLSVQPLKTFTAPYESMKVLSYVHPKDVKSFSRSLNINQLPKKLAIVVLTEEQHQGVRLPSAINFKHQNVECIRVICNGQTYPTPAGMNLDFKNKAYLEGYHSLFTQLNAIAPPFNADTYDDGYAIFGVDLPPGHKPTKVDKNGIHGTCDVDIQFAEKPKENLVITIFCFYDAQFSFTKAGITHSGELKL